MAHPADLPEAGFREGDEGTGDEDLLERGGGDIDARSVLGRQSGIAPDSAAKSGVSNGTARLGDIVLPFTASS